jgi:8-oxo-dGTP pyrophosphatase MutT (NUDIX family)
MSDDRARRIDVGKEVETVRCIVQRSSGEILLLQKSADSKAASLFEFPGGKIDHISGAVSTPAEQRVAVMREVLEEANIDLTSCPPDRKDEFSYSFTPEDIEYSRRVHLFHVVLPPGDVEIIIDRTTNAQGGSEDKHQRYVWVSVAELIGLRDSGQLSGNSQRFALALGIEQ